MRLLLIGLALGLGLGFWIGHADTPPQRGERTSAIPERETLPANRPTREIEEPAGPEAVPTNGMGLLVVELGGTDYDFTSILVLGASLHDDRGVAKPFDFDQIGARYRLWPGDYRLEWYDEQGDAEQRTRVTVRAGKTVRVRIADVEAHPYDPIPSGRARLRIRVRDLDGGELPGVSVQLQVGVLSGYEREQITVDGRGAWSGDLPATHVRLRLGGQKAEVVLKAGRESLVEFAYHTEGEVRLLGSVYGDPFLTPPGELGPEERIGQRWHNRVLYVPPGEYDLWWRLSTEEKPRFIQRIVVEAHRAISVRPTLPSGQLVVHVHVPERVEKAKARLARIDDEDAPKTIWMRWRNHSPKRPEVLWFQHLPPGRWSLTISAHGYIAHEQVVRIDDVTVRRAVTMMSK